MTTPKHYPNIEQGLRTTLWGILINLCLVIAKGGVGIIGNSYAMIADAIESATDILSSLVVWFGLKIAIKVPDKDHPFGHGKAEPIATMVVGLSLLGAAVYIAIQSIVQMQTPHPLPEGYTLIVLTIIIVIKELLFRWVNKIGKELKSSVVKADAWHHRSDAITSGAVFIGITTALIGGPGYESADDWAALFASVIIAYNGVSMFRPALAEIMDAAPSDEIEMEVRRISIDVHGVLGLDKCRVRKMGFAYYVDLHIRVNGLLSVREGHTIAHEVKNAIQAAYPFIHDVLVHVEPYN